MPLLRPDPTFYPSPRVAMHSPPEKLGYVALINPKRSGAHDAVAAWDDQFYPDGIRGWMAKVDLESE